jgi:hypothetical protein
MYFCPPTLSAGTGCKDLSDGMPASRSPLPMRLIRSLHFETVACLGRRWPSYEGLIEVDAGKPHSQKPASAICSKCLQTQASEGRRSSKM